MRPFCSSSRLCRHKAHAPNRASGLCGNIEPAPPCRPPNSSRILSTATPFWETLYRPHHLLFPQHCSVHSHLSLPARLRPPAGLDHIVLSPHCIRRQRDGRIGEATHRGRHRCLRMDLRSHEDNLPPHRRQLLATFCNLMLAGQLRSQVLAPHNAPLSSQEEWHVRSTCSTPCTTSSDALPFPRLAYECAPLSPLCNFALVSRMGPRSAAGWPS